MVKQAQLGKFQDQEHDQLEVHQQEGAYQMLIQNQGVHSSRDKIQQVVSVTILVLDMQTGLAHGFLRSVKLSLSRITGLPEWITSSKKAFFRYLMSSRL